MGKLVLVMLCGFKGGSEMVVECKVSRRGKGEVNFLECQLGSSTLGYMRIGLAV